MKIMSEKTRVLSLAILSGILIGALSLWLIVGSEEPEFDRFQETALCTLDLPAETTTVSTTFTIAKPLEKFLVAIKTGAKDEALEISISDDKSMIASASGMLPGTFGLGLNIQPGTYTLSVSQDLKGKGGLIIISSEKPVYLTGCQIWSRTYIALLSLSGICAVLLRKSKDIKKRALSLAIFHSLLLGFSVIFTYLLFHEGGHTLAQFAFGHFDLARSDFWGIYGHPHSGGTMGPALEPWQQALISCAGPMLPTFVGFMLFLLWRLQGVQRLRNLRPMVNLYFSAIVANLVLPEAVIGPTYLLGFVTAEGDLIGYATRTGGPVWLVKGLLWIASLLSALILWQLVPEIWNSWRTQFLRPSKSAFDSPQL